MKRVLLVLIMVSMLISGTPIFAINSYDLTVNVDGRIIEFDVQPYINEDNRIMVPLRFVSEALDAEVKWNPHMRMVTVFKDNMEVRLIIDMNAVEVKRDNEIEIIVLDTTPILLEGRTMVPLRFISEIFGATVNWKGDTRTVTIFTESEEDLTDSEENFIEPEIELLYGEEGNEEIEFSINLKNWEEYLEQDYSFKFDILNYNKMNEVDMLVDNTENEKVWKRIRINTWEDKPTENIYTLGEYYTTRNSEFTLEKGMIIEYKFTVRNNETNEIKEYLGQAEYKQLINIQQGFIEPEIELLYGEEGNEEVEFAINLNNWEEYLDNNYSFKFDILNYNEMNEVDILIGTDGSEKVWERIKINEWEDKLNKNIYTLGFYYTTRNSEFKLEKGMIIEYKFTVRNDKTEEIKEYFGEAEYKQLMRLPSTYGSDSYYRLVSVNNGKVLDVGNIRNNVHVSEVVGSTGEMWQAKWITNDIFVFINGYSLQGLTELAVDDLNNNVYTTEISEPNRQMWTKVSSNNDENRQFNIMNLSSGKVLDVCYSSNNVYIAEYNGSSTQYWEKIQFEYGDFIIKNQFRGKVLSIEKLSNIAEKSEVNDSEAQIWAIVPLDNGYFTIVNAKYSFKVLEAREDSIFVSETRFEEQFNQHWKLMPTPSGYILVSRETGKVLDVGDNQQWKLEKVELR